MDELHAMVVCIYVKTNAMKNWKYVRNCLVLALIQVTRNICIFYTEQFQGLYDVKCAHKLPK